MPTLHRQPFHLSSMCYWRCLALCVIVLLLWLGVWQVERAQEKQRLIDAQSVMKKRAPVIWKHGNVNPAPYQLIRLTGQFLPILLLLDNQHHQHQWGYHVVSPLKIEGGQIVLIDRGWVLGDGLRSVFPEVNTPKETVSFVGEAYYPMQSSWHLGPLIEKKRSDFAIVECLDPVLISKFLHKPVYPFIIRLHSSADFGFVRDWPVVAMPPVRHYGYALQWFSMAAVSLIILVAMTIKKNDLTNE